MRRDVERARWLLLLGCVVTLAACGEEGTRTAAPAATATQASASTALTAAPGVDARDAWARLMEETGPGWRTHVNHRTGRAQRLYGAGIKAPGSVADAAAAEAHARAFLARHVEALAPGSRVEDFELVSNHLGDGMRSVGFAQRAQGMLVIGGQVSFRYKADRLFVIGLEAAPSVRVERPDAAQSAAAVERAARDWLASEAAEVEVTGAVEGPLVLALEEDGAAPRVVQRVEVTTRAPIGRWDVFVDAQTGAPVHREQTLMFGEGAVRFRVPERWPAGGYIEAPARRMRAFIEGGTLVANDDGLLLWDGDLAQTFTARALGVHVNVVNDSGELAGRDFTLAPGEQALWEVSEPTEEAQLSAFIHANAAKAYARALAPDMSWLGGTLRVTVNIDDTCNAFSDGDAINFYVAGDGCENTGRLADVVYHEFGHSFHVHAVIQGVGQFEEALSEGLSDYLAATMTGDPAMGRGFFTGSNAPLRHINPQGEEAVWPDDVRFDPHSTGLIIGGALWDLRALLVARHGEEAGVALTDRLYFQAMQRASDIPTMYVEVLAADDDDGDLTNGTPNGCDILAAFEAHGLASYDAQATTLDVTAPVAEGFEVELTLEGITAQCLGGGATATLAWRPREAPEAGGEVVMTREGDVFTAVIPPQDEGQVIQYQVRLSSEATTLSWPRNPADPFYEFFVGAVAPIYCTDFEADPLAEGWGHGLLQGDVREGADDWQWGTPTGASNDPREAFSPTRVFGNDLGHQEYNGAYQPDKVNYGETPLIEVGDHAFVRLQYRRWLSVEDATYDQGSIYANDQLVWQNLATPEGDVQHVDGEWRFHDVDLSDAVVDGAVRVRFEIASDGGLEFGGWSIDDFCVVAYDPGLCGDGVVSAGEACDAGASNSDAAPDACRADCTLAACGDGVIDSAEACDDGNTDDGDGCSATCAGEASCGDGVVDEGEVCDAGAANTDGGEPGSCTTTCERIPDELSTDGEPTDGEPTDGEPTDGAASTDDGGGDAGQATDAGVEVDGEGASDGCSCQVAAAPTSRPWAPGALLALVFGALVVARRRRS